MATIAPNDFIAWARKPRSQKALDFVIELANEKEHEFVDILAKLKKDGKRPLLVACDVYRPAAIKQLQVVGESVGVPVFEMGDKVSPVTIAKEAINHAKKLLFPAKKL